MPVVMLLFRYILLVMVTMRLQNGIVELLHWREKFQLQEVVMLYMLSANIGIVDRQKWEHIHLHFQRDQ